MMRAMQRKSSVKSASSRSAQQHGTCYYQHDHSAAVVRLDDHNTAMLRLADHNTAVLRLDHHNTAVIMLIIGRDQRINDINCNMN